MAEWVVKVWHYNRDGGSIKGADFEVTVTDLNDTLYRFYSKEFRGPTVRPRLERVETPGKPLVELMGQVLSEAPP